MKLGWVIPLTVFVSVAVFSLASHGGAAARRFAAGLKLIECVGVFSFSSHRGAEAQRGTVELGRVISLIVFAGVLQWFHWPHTATQRHGDENVFCF